MFQRLYLDDSRGINIFDMQNIGQKYHFYYIPTTFSGGSLKIYWISDDEDDSILVSHQPLRVYPYPSIACVYNAMSGF